MKNCERCTFKAPPDDYSLIDYCAHCGKNLCGKCMAEGCCGVVPADSGDESDNDPQADAVKAHALWVKAKAASPAKQHGRE